MERTPELLKKIDSRETELQRAYDFAVEEHAKWQGIYLGAEQKMKEAKALIDKCVKRAKDQNCLDVL